MLQPHPSLRRERPTRFVAVLLGYTQQLRQEEIQRTSKRLIAG
jgi:hypothetical protein